MDNLLKKEKYILSETVTKERGSFIYELHDNHFFNKEKLDRLLIECKSLSSLYKKNGKSEQYCDVLKGVVSIFQHMLFLISCHFMPDDEFIIINYDSDLSSELISDYYIEFRVIINALII